MARAARPFPPLVLALLVSLALLERAGLPAGGAAQGLDGQAAPAASGAPRRIVSLIPAVTEMLFAIGAGPQVVGVSRFDRYPPEVEHRPRVGGLLDPDLERLLGLAPDLVIVYRSQVDLRDRLARAGIAVLPYAHGGLAEITRTLRELGRRTGHAAAAEALAARIEARLAEVAAAVRGRPRPRTLLVVGRDRGMLRGIYASGGVGFLHDLLELAGGRNVFAAIRREAVPVSTEQILAAAPELIVELHPATDGPATALEAEARVWDRLAALPAVRTRRVSILVGDELVIPGPRIAQGARRLAAVLHPEVVR